MNRLTITAFSARVRFAMASLALLLMHAAAHAQEAVAAPQPALQKSPPIWLGLFVIFILLALVVFVSLLPSKRSHQD